MTTLRYTPDKPYKLSMNAVNSEVDIFGMTDDLYYIRHGKNFGFLPKGHLREKARGNYPFDIEIDLGSRRLDKEARENNFVYEFLTASQATAPVQPNETVSAPAVNETQPAPVNEPNEELKPADPSIKDIPFDIPLDKPDETTPGPPSEVKPPSAASEEDENDSGIDDGDEDDEDDDETDSEEASEETTEKPAVIEAQQPELVAIPPGKDKDAEKVAEVVAEAPKVVTEPPKVETAPEAVPVPASSAEVLPEVKDSHNETAQEPALDSPKIEDELKASPVTDSSPSEVPAAAQPPANEVPKFIPIKDEAVEKIESLLEAENATVTEQPAEVPAPQVVEKEIPKLEEVAVEAPFVNDTIGSADQDNLNAYQNDTLQEVPQLDSAEKPADTPEAEKPSEVPTPEVIEEPKVEVPEIKEPVVTEQVVPEHVETVTQQPLAEETTTEAQVIEQPQQPQLEEPITTAVPEILEIPPADTKPPQEEITDTKPPSPPVKSEPDALLQKFNEKLGHKFVENTGHGSVEPIVRPDHMHGHLHSHDHSHEHHGHIHSHGGPDHSHGSHVHSHGSHDHSHPEPPLTVQEEKSAELEDEDDGPGFFSGLFSFFSSKDEATPEIHEHEQPGSVFHPIADQAGEFVFVVSVERS